MRSSLVVGAALSASVCGVSCHRGAPQGTGESAPSASAPTPAPSGQAPLAQASGAVPVEVPDPRLIPTAWPIPQGPRFAILAGVGIGPIQFGARVDTIERLMEVPCEIKTESACRYVGRGVEFTLKNGVVAEIHTHRLGRPTTPKPRTFGIFNGKCPNEVAFMMLQDAARSLMGEKPKKTEAVTDGGDPHTVAVDTYDGLRLEYDQLPNGSVVVGGIVVVPGERAHAAKAAVPRAK